MKRFSSIAALTALLLTAAACGDDTTQAGDAAPADTTSVDAPRRSSACRPLTPRCCSRSAPADQIIAVDDQSNYPGRGARQAARPVGLRAERRGDRCAAARPGGHRRRPDDLSGQLEPLGIDGVDRARRPPTFDDVYAQIEQLGAATGHIGEAAELVARCRPTSTARSPPHRDGRAG